MAYKALYRTYRPQTFSDVTGQEVVVKTLQNAIINKKISHAYLFSGPRGTGKTSVARIFAKALNCTNLVDGEPCDKCISCQEISDGINPDVIEIDAASNNGVDEIRDIREKVKFLPSGSKYKIYIIDEVHMLSGGAFNALLKTLEEPPKHVVFILATTEPQKLPATIISRCQRFEFKALTVEEISERVKSICALEDVSITEEALNSIGESAEGGMRDALSILDQAISYGNKEITIDDINEVTGSLSFEKIINLANAIDKKDVHVTLEIVNELISDGKEISKIINSLLVFYRDVLLYKSVGTSGFSKFVFTKEKFQELSLNIPMSKIMYFVDILSDIQNKVRYTTTPNVFLEIALIKMCNISVDELDIMKRVTELENKLNSLGDIDFSNINSNNNCNNSPVDSDKLNRLDAMVNQILSELNRLELPRQIDKINKLMDKENAPTDKALESEVQRLKDKVEEIDLFVNKDGSNGSVPDELYQRIEALENGKVAVNQSNEPINLNPIKDKIIELENKLENKEVNNDKVDLTEVYNRLEVLENSNNNPTVKDAILDNENVDLSEIYNRLEVLENNDKNTLDTPKIDVESVDLTDVYNRIKTLENNVREEINNLNLNNNNQSNIDLISVYKRLDNLENNNELIDQVNVKVNEINANYMDVMNDINELKETVENIQNNKNVPSGNVSEDLSEISDKLMFLERRVYQIMAGELASKKPVKKASKKNNGQIMLFGDDILSLSNADISNKEKFDFDELEKSDEEIKQSKLEALELKKKQEQEEQEQELLDNENEEELDSDIEEIDEPDEVYDIEDTEEIVESINEVDNNINPMDDIPTLDLDIDNSTKEEEEIKPSNNSVFITGNYEVNKEQNNNVINSIISEEAKPTLFEKDKKDLTKTIEENKQPSLFDEIPVDNDINSVNNNMINGINNEPIRDIEDSPTRSLFDEAQEIDEPDIDNQTNTLFNSSENNATNNLFGESDAKIETSTKQDNLFNGNNQEIETFTKQDNLFNGNNQEIETSTKQDNLFNGNNQEIETSTKQNDLFNGNNQEIETSTKQFNSVNEEHNKSLFDFEPVVNNNINNEVKQEHNGLFEAAQSIIEKPVVEKVSNNVVSEYYDQENNAQVINKERSSLVVREKETNDNNYALEQDLIARETEPVVKEVEPVMEQPRNNENFARDKFASYDIKYIEQIMHDSRSMESRNDKNRIDQIWKVMSRGVRPEYLSIIETLQEGKVAVVGNKEFIIVFPNVNLCNQVMRAKFKDIALRILYNVLNDTYNYIALPIDVWTQKSIEYKQQYQIGIKYPTLKPLDIKGLEIISNADEYKNEAEKAINQTIKLFGKDNINFE